MLIKTFSMTCKNNNQLTSKQVTTLAMNSFTNYMGIHFPTSICPIRLTIITQESPIEECSGVIDPIHSNLSSSSNNRCNN